MASLVIVEGNGQGSHFPLTLPSVSLGRDDTCTFQVLDPLVSRDHRSFASTKRWASMWRATIGAGTACS